MRKLWRVLGDQRIAFLAILTLAVLAMAIEAVLHPLMIKWLFDEAVVTRNFNRFMQLSLAYLSLGLVVISLYYVTSLWQKAVENRATLAIEGHLLGKVLALDWRLFNREGPGYYVSRIHKDALEGITPASGLVIDFARQAVGAVVFAGVVFYLEWQAALALLVIVPPLMWASEWIGRRVRQATSEEREEEGRFLQLITQTLKAFELLRGLPWLRPPALDANRAGLGTYLDRIYQNHRLRSTQQAMSDLFMNLANVAALVVGAYYVLAGQLSFGGFLAFVNAFWRAVTAASSLLRRASEFYRYGEVLRRLEALLALSPREYVASLPVLRVQDLQVSYDGKPVLAVPRLELRAGERAVLVGPNGSGKTTLLRVLAGYLEPDAGLVAVPGRTAGLVGPLDLPPLPVRELVKDPSLIEALGLGDQLDLEANELSSGQRQKVAIGALLSVDADIYILDEPLANLDPESRKRVMDLILEKTRGKTLIAVQHGEAEWHGSFHQVLSLPARHVSAGLDHAPSTS